MFEHFQAAGKRLHLTDKLNIEAIEGESLEAKVLKIQAALNLNRQIIIIMDIVDINFDTSPTILHVILKV